MGTSGTGARLNALHAIEERIEAHAHAQHVERAGAFVLGSSRGTVPNATPIPSAHVDAIEPFDPDVFAPLHMWPESDDESESE